MLTHCGTQTIETEHLVLRRFTLEDWESMQKNWISSPAIQHGYAEPTYETEESIKELLTTYIKRYENKDTYRWGIFSKEDGECIGQIAYFLVDSKNHFGEIEYCIGTDYQKRGYATEATKAVIGYGFEQINFNKVQICHKANNDASRRVIEKLGFVKEGVSREYFFRDGEYIDRVYYSILKREWHK